MSNSLNDNYKNLKKTVEDMKIEIEYPKKTQTEIKREMKMQEANKNLSGKPHQHKTRQHRSENLRHGKQSKRNRNRRNSQRKW